MRIGKKGLTVRGPMVMGILNVTPDSFSDGGSHYPDGAVEHALRMIEDGADIIDIGGESTRPGSDPVPSSVEIERIVPVIEKLSSMTDVPISVDTMKADVAEAALKAGADIVNDVNGLRSEGMLDVVSSFGAPVIIMHMHGMPKTMQASPMEGHVTETIASFLKERCETAHDHGIRDMILDPGVGFGKTTEQNVEIVDNSGRFSFGHPVLIGASRKRFLSDIYPGIERDEATVSISIRALDAGADIVRVHNVRAMVDALSQHPQYGPRRKDRNQR